MIERKLRITRIPSWSLKRRLTILATIFGIIWLFFEPLPALGVQIGTFQLSSLGIVGYLGLVIVALFLTFMWEFISRNRLSGKLTFANFTIVLTEDGRRIQVEAPQDMRVGEFVKLFLEEVSKDAAPKTALSRAYMYTHTLLVERAGQDVPLPNERTIREVGLCNDDVCKIRLDNIIPTFLSGGMLLTKPFATILKEISLRRKNK